MARAAILAVSLLWSASPAVSADTPVRIYIDVVGTRQVSPDDLEKRFKTELAQYVGIASRQGTNWARQADSIRLGMERKVLAMGDFVWVQVGFHQEQAQDGKDAYFIFEIVERGDAETRMPFRRPPRGSFPDPDGLLQAWADYMETGARLLGVDVGSIPGGCAGFYCPWGGSNSQLQAIEAKFEESVPQRRAALEQILSSDANALHRMRALYLLTYVKRGDHVLRFCVQSLADPDERVRDAAMRILTDIALRRPELPIPIESLTAVLNYPYSEDRTRAMAVLLSLADKPAYHPYLVLHSAQQILHLLRLKDPSNHQMAYMALGLMSGETHGDREYDAWETWWSRARVAVTLGKSQGK